MFYFIGTLILLIISKLKSMAQRFLFSASSIHGPLLMNSKYDIWILIFLQHNICCISGLHCKLLEEMLYVTRALCEIASHNIFIICEIVVLTWTYFPTDTHSRNWSLYCHFLWSSGAWDSNDAVPWKTTQWTLMLDGCCDVINAERHADAVFFLF